MTQNIQILTSNLNRAVARRNEARRNADSPRYSKVKQACYALEADRLQAAIDEVAESLTNLLAEGESR